MWLTRLLLAVLLEDVGEGAASAVVAVRVHSHEHAGAAVRALLAQALDLVRAVDLVELQHCELHLFVLAWSWNESGVE